jgi:hypothetical protein
MILRRDSSEDDAVARIANGVTPKAERFGGRHKRAPRKNIIGIQYRVGHKLLSTTSRYVKPSFRAAMETIAVATPEPANLGAPQKKTPKRKTA